ncbi:MAG: type IV pili twitching motility protein PilT, partial [Candidatus Pacebacteria bacterium]|nr:type IV pili twitching motility protein PilT [Candidatus Paceibacterota bacterium]
MESERSLKKFINILVHEGGSDLHLSAGSHPTIRVASALVSLTKEPIL